MYNSEEGKKEGIARKKEMKKLLEYETNIRKIYNVLWEKRGYEWREIIDIINPDFTIETIVNKYFENGQYAELKRKEIISFLQEYVDKLKENVIEPSRKIDMFFNRIIEEVCKKLYREEEMYVSQKDRICSIEEAQKSRNKIRKNESRNFFKKESNNPLERMIDEFSVNLNFPEKKVNLCFAEQTQEESEIFGQSIIENSEITNLEMYIDVLLEQTQEINKGYEGAIDFGNGIYGCTSKGQNEENQDNLIGISNPGNPDFSIIVVADGMGGEKNGDKASKILIEEIVDWFIHLRPELYFEKNNEKLKELLNIKIKEIGQKIIEELGGEKKGGTTFVGAITGEKNIIIANAGDSRGYVLLQDGKLQQATKDDSFVGELLEKGIFVQGDGKTPMTTDEVKFSPISNIIKCCIGYGVSDELKIYEYDKKDVKRILLMSDGIYDLVSFEVIETIMKAKNAKNIPYYLVSSSELQNAQFPLRILMKIKIGKSVYGIAEGTSINGIIINEINENGDLFDKSGCNIGRIDKIGHIWDKNKRMIAWIDQKGIIRYTNGKLIETNPTVFLLEHPLGKDNESAIFIGYDQKNTEEEVK